MESEQNDIDVDRIEVLVIGAGISGIATVKCLQDAGFNVVAFERTGDVGGLWAFKPKAYGVMSFTHINVSKQNYSFSDFPFPEGCTDYPHNREMAEYVRSYVKHFDLEKVIRFHTQVNCIEKKGEEWLVTAEDVEESDEGVITATGNTRQYLCTRVAIATGHHAKPVVPTFPGQDQFRGKLYHSVDFSDAELNGATSKRVVIVGIGNSAVDAACNCAEAGRCKPVYISSRSGAWVVPNYVFGSPVDHYACRLFLWLPWRLGSFVFENVIKIVSGNPKRWDLNPKMHVLQTQPTVSPTLIHHIQRKEIVIKPNIQKFDEDGVVFTDGSRVGADHVILCTGYSIDLPYVQDDLRKRLLNADTNEIKLFKNVFSPELGHSLAFIGFVQPASGGVISMSEMQARWWAELCRGTVKLPVKAAMLADIEKEKIKYKSRFYRSNRHTIQRDPILYNDDIAERIGCKPSFSAHPWLAWRLLLGSCGTAQYRLQGPGKWSRAEAEVKKVPVTAFLCYGTPVAVVLLYYLITYLLSFLFGLIF